MASSSSSFLSRLSLRRDAGPVLPLHMGSHQRSPPPENRRHDDYDLANLSPRAEDSLLFSADPDPSGAPASRPDRSPSSTRSRTPSRRNDIRSTTSKERQRPQRVLFAGPPPPIATSTLLYRDVEDRDGSAVASSRGRGHGNVNSDAASSSASVAMIGRRQKPTVSSRDTSSFDRQQSAAWAILQQRERGLQREIQALLDVQSAGLAAGLGRASSPVERSPSTSTNSRTGGGARSLLHGDGSSRSSTPTRPVVAAATESIYATPAGAVVPVRQPRPRKLGLRGARAGLARSISLLADLKAEEGALLAEALAARQQALAHLGALTGRRSALVKELRALDMDAADADADEETAADATDSKEASAGKDPLVRELATLQRAHAGTAQQIAKLEGQLAMLRERQRTLEARIGDAQSRREAGLSGYRGALKDVDAQLAAVLRRPPMQPLDEAIVFGGDDDNDDDEGGSDSADKYGDATNGVSHRPPLPAPGGAEFLRMRPERRTADMAQFWWETEAQILGRRLRAVERERAALDEGGAVWQAAVQLVSEFETGLRHEMAENEDESDGEGDTFLTPEEKMRRQLAKMADVIAGLGGHLRTAEDRGWNLLLCAIGAELEAFQEARSMLLQALRLAEGGSEEEEKGSGATGTNVDGAGDDDVDGASAAATPRLAQSTSDAMTSFRTAASTVSVRRAAADDTGRDEDRGTLSESDDNNDVPPELLVAHEDDDVPPDLLVARDAAMGAPHDEDEAGRGPDRGHDDAGSENEVPLEFFSEQERDGEA